MLKVDIRTFAQLVDGLKYLNLALTMDDTKHKLQYLSVSHSMFSDLHQTLISMLKEEEIEPTNEI